MRYQGRIESTVSRCNSEELRIWQTYTDHGLPVSGSQYRLIQLKKNKKENKKKERKKERIHREKWPPLSTCCYWDIIEL